MNFYELLFNRGQPSGEGMTHFERLFAAKLAGGEIKELEGVPPLLFKANGEPLIDWIIYGNMVQNGTPTPQNPVMPQGCGERTGNLVEDYIANCNIQSDGKMVSNPSFNMFVAKILQGQTYSLDTTLVGGFFTSKPSIGSVAYNNNRDTSGVRSFVAPIDGYVAFRKSSTETTAMLNTGSEPLPYEPYGYKIPISSASTTTPVYLGEIESTRRIKKLVLTGEENWRLAKSGGLFVYSNIHDYYRVTGVDICLLTHYIAQPNLNSNTQVLDKHAAFYSNPTNVYDDFYIFDSDYADASTFKTYLQQQYAAGTPVTVYYVLETPETGIFNEPIRKIGDYADSLTATQAGVEIPTIKGNNTLDIDTTLKPSNVYIKYKT